MSVYLIATLDTKGAEAAFLAQCLKQLGIAVTIVDTSCVGEAAFTGDVTADAVFRAAGTSLTDVRARNDRGAAVTQAAQGATQVLAAAFQRGDVQGVLGLGGSAGTTIGTSAMRALPLGLPKLMVSTLASGDVRQYVGDKDIMMLNSVVDIAGLNRISRAVLSNAAAAMAGMIQHRVPIADNDKPLVAATMFGVTTPCVQRAREVLEAAGYEVLVFHATGSGGQSMESLIREGLFAGVLDLTTTELADELVGGVLSAGPTRLTAAGQCGVPQVVSVGATDMVNFWGRETVPERFQQRTLHAHNSTVTLMRTTLEENAKIGAMIGRKVAAATGPAAILLPLRGVSALDRTGQAFDDPAARAALFEGVRQHHGHVELVELDRHINDAEFAEAAAHKLIELLNTPTRKAP